MCQAARGWLWLLGVIPALVLGGCNGAGFAVAVPGVLLPLADLWFQRWYSARGIRFDGERWWIAWRNSPATPLRRDCSAYRGAILLSIRLRHEGAYRTLLLWRWQVDRETWRRLQLAARAS